MKDWNCWHRSSLMFGVDENLRCVRPSINGAQRFAARSDSRDQRGMAPRKVLRRGLASRHTIELLGQFAGGGRICTHSGHKPIAAIEKCGNDVEQTRRLT